MSAMVTLSNGAQVFQHVLDALPPDVDPLSVFKPEVQNADYAGAEYNTNDYMDDPKYQEAASKYGQQSVDAYIDEQGGIPDRTASGNIFTDFWDNLTNSFDSGIFGGGGGGDLDPGQEESTPGQTPTDPIPADGTPTGSPNVTSGGPVRFPVRDILPADQALWDSLVADYGVEAAINIWDVQSTEEIKGWRHSTDPIGEGDNEIDATDGPYEGGGNPPTGAGTVPVVEEGEDGEPGPGDTTGGGADPDANPIPANDDPFNIPGVDAATLEKIDYSKNLKAWQDEHYPNLGNITDQMTENAQNRVGLNDPYDPLAGIGSQQGANIDSPGTRQISGMPGDFEGDTGGAMAPPPPGADPSLGGAPTTVEGGYSNDDMGREQWIIDNFGEEAAANWIATQGTAGVPDDFASSTAPSYPDTDEGKKQYLIDTHGEEAAENWISTQGFAGLPDDWNATRAAAGTDGGDPTRTASGPIEAAIIEGLFAVFGSVFADQNTPPAPSSPGTATAAWPHLNPPPQTTDPRFKGLDPRLMGIPDYFDIRDAGFDAMEGQYLQDYEMYARDQSQLDLHQRNLQDARIQQGAMNNQIETDRERGMAEYTESQGTRTEALDSATGALDGAQLAADANMDANLADIQHEKQSSTGARDLALGKLDDAAGQVDQGLGMQLDSIEETRSMIDQAIAGGQAGIDLATQAGRELMEQGLDYAQALPDIIKAAGQDSYDAIKETMDKQFSEAIGDMKSEWQSMMASAQGAFDKGEAADMNRTAELMQTLSSTLYNNIDQNLTALQSSPQFREMAGDQQNAALGQIKLSGAIESGNLLADVGAKENNRLATNQIQRNSTMAQMKTAFGNAITQGISGLTASRWGVLSERAGQALSEYGQTLRASGEMTANLLDQQATRELTGAIEKGKLGMQGNEQQMGLTKMAIDAIGARNAQMGVIAQNMADTINAAADRGVQLTESSVAVRNHNSEITAGLAADRADIEKGFATLNAAAEESFRNWAGQTTMAQANYNMAMNTLQLQGSVEAYNMGKNLYQPKMSIGIAQLTASLFNLGTGILQQDFQNRLQAFAAEFGRAQYVQAPILAATANIGERFANNADSPSGGGGGATGPDGGQVALATGAGTASGALSGAAAGSMIAPGPGTLIGGIVGGIAGGLGGLSQG